MSQWSQRSIAVQAYRDGEVPAEAICHEMVLFPVVPPNEHYHFDHFQIYKCVEWTV